MFRLENSPITYILDLLSRDISIDVSTNHTCERRSLPEDNSCANLIDMEMLEVKSKHLCNRNRGTSDRAARSLRLTHYTDQAQHALVK